MCIGYTIVTMFLDPSVYLGSIYSMYFSISDWYGGMLPVWKFDWPLLSGNIICCENITATYPQEISENLCITMLSFIFFSHACDVYVFIHVWCLTVYVWVFVCACVCKGTWMNWGTRGWNWHQGSSSFFSTLWTEIGFLSWAKISPEWVVSHAKVPGEILSLYSKH